MDRHSTYTALLLRHRTQMWRMCWLRAHGNWDRCCDLLQEASIALWLNMDKLRADATAAEENAWVRWQVRSLFEHMGRRKQPQVEPLTAVMAESVAADDRRHIEEEMDEVMAALNPDEQRMLRLQLEGYRSDEIAAIMGLNRDAVYQRMHRAMAKVRSVVLVLLAMMVTTTVAIAVVPHWRHVLFGKEDEPLPVEEIKPTVPQDTIVAEAPPPASRPKPAPREHMEPMEHLESVELEAPEQLTATHDAPVISIDGNSMTVSGVYGERVTVYSKNGSLLASQMCNGICTFTLFPDDNMLTSVGRYDDIIVKIGDRPKVTIIQ